MALEGTQFLCHRANFPLRYSLGVCTPSPINALLELPKVNPLLQKYFQLDYCIKPILHYANSSVHKGNNSILNNRLSWYLAKLFINKLLDKGKCFPIFLLTCRYQGHRTNLRLRRLITIHVTHTDITDQGVIQAGEGWREKQELHDMMSDPLPQRTRLLSSLICRLTKRLKFLLHLRHIGRKKKTLKLLDVSRFVTL